MLCKIAHDLINDIAIIKTQFCYNVRYGLEVTPCDTLAEAFATYHACLGHALECQGLPVYEGREGAA